MVILEYEGRQRANGLSFALGYDIVNRRVYMGLTGK